MAHKTNQAHGHEQKRRRKLSGKENAIVIIIVAKRARNSF